MPFDGLLHAKGCSKRPARVRNGLDVVSPAQAPALVASANTRHVTSTSMARTILRIAVRASSARVGDADLDLKATASARGGRPRQRRPRRLSRSTLCPVSNAAAAFRTQEICTGWRSGANEGGVQGDSTTDFAAECCRIEIAGTFHSRGDVASGMHSSWARDRETRRPCATVSRSWSARSRPAPSPRCRRRTPADNARLAALHFINGHLEPGFTIGTPGNRSIR